MQKLPRRDFLKVGTAIAGGAALAQLSTSTLRTELPSASTPPNILIIVLDAMSATNLSLYGYPRRTSPNLELFAGRSTVYHQHYAPGNFTTPGTASLLTGMYPWTHRAINQGGLVARRLVDQNIFRAFGQTHQRVAFSQNPWPNYFFGQFRRDIETVIPASAFGLVQSLAGEKFDSDLVGSYRAFDDFLLQDGVPPASLLLGLGVRLHGIANLPPAEADASGFTLRHVFDGLIGALQSLQAPWFAYLHLLPPHAPYRPSAQFKGLFADGWSPPRKPGHRLVDPHTHRSITTLNELRQTYDEYIANLDAEFGRLSDFLEQSGILDHSHVVVTSDHGEFFERGEQGHLTPLLYDPVVRIPLLVTSPGQSSRVDVRVPTSNVDLLPTLAHLSGLAAPEWCEGAILPALGGVENPDRSIFMMEAQTQPAFEPIKRASFAMRKGAFKLIDYMGYPQYRVEHRFEMYDLQNDPDELENIYSDTMSAARNMKDELLQQIQIASAGLAAP